MKNHHLIIMGAAVAAGAYLFIRKGGAASLSALPNGSLMFGRSGQVYTASPRPDDSWSAALTGGTINLANSSQMIVPSYDTTLIRGY